MPGFRVVCSPCLEPLAERLAATLAAEPLPPGTPETVLLAQNNGLRPWLEHRLAERLGCAAALDVRSPQALTTALMRFLVPETRPADPALAEVDPFDRQVMTWRLAALLEALPEAPVYAPLRAYLARTQAAMPLARRLARLFDDYQAYRPEVLAAWCRGELPDAPTPHAAWQAALWQRLHADLAGPGGRPVLDRAAGVTRLVETLRGRRSAPEGLPERLSVFGARLLPPLYYRVLDAIARHRTVTLYTVAAGLPADPYAEAFGRDGFAHPLLRALGGHTRDFVAVLRDVGAPPVEALPAPPAEALVAPTALGTLQAALVADAPPALRPLDPADRSIRVIDAHSPLRELEVLRDHLCHAFDTLPGLRPSDVLVVVPDLVRFAPLVDAVFGEAVSGARLPYHVAEHPHAPARRVLDAFRKALRLRESRVTASELLDLLDEPAVARRAGIREEEIGPLRGWLHEAGVRWGLDGTRKAAFGLPEDDFHTWRFGLDRLLLGYATGETDHLVLGHAPCTAPGLEGADLLGRFAEWADGLFHHLARLARRSRSLEEWPAVVAAFADALFEPDADEELEAVLFLRERAAGLARLHALGVFPEASASFEAVRAHLEAEMGAFEPPEPYLTGRITVAPPFPLRHAPHRVIAFVGLNDGAYPAPEDVPGYDLIALDPRPGDAAPRRTEKQLFLDAVTAARERLILSFSGRSEKDNSERAASVVLEAFLDACDRHFGPEARARLVERHRLQPFSPAYFSGTDGLFTYAAQHRLDAPRVRTAVPRFFDATLTSDDTPGELPLRELAAAWSEPARFVARRRLRLRLDDPAAAFADDEPLALDGLDAFALRQLLLDGLLDGADEAALAERLRVSGRLPAGAPGRVWLRRLLAEVRPLVERVRACGPAEPVPLALGVHGRTLVGVAERVTPAGALVARAGRIRPKDLVAAWVEHLALCATAGDEPLATHCFGTAGSCRFEPLDADGARLHLQSLVRGYEAIQSSPPPLFPNASFTYASKVHAGDRRAFAERLLARERGEERNGIPVEVNDRALREARRQFEGGFGITGDGAEPHVALCVRGTEPLAEARPFALWSLALWAPLLAHHAEDGP